MTNNDETHEKDQPEKSAKGNHRCGAKTRSGKPCQLWAMPNGRCGKHGGLTPRGAASPHFKTGRYSRDLPTRMASRYQEAVADPELLSLREEIAAIDARVSDLLGRVDTGEAGVAWRNATDAFFEVQTAISKQDVFHMQVGLTKLENLLAKGRNDYAAWGEVINLFEARRRLVVDERKRLVEMNQVITAERAMLLVGAIIEIIRRNVSDRNVLSSISREISTIVEEGGR